MTEDHKLSIVLALFFAALAGSLLYNTWGGN